MSIQFYNIVKILDFILFKIKKNLLLTFAKNCFLDLF